MSKEDTKIYKNLFFDLDRTLWDYAANSEKTLRDLLNRHAPELNSKVEEFLKSFYHINDALWIEYRNGRLTKDVLSIKRFLDTFNSLGVDASAFAKEFSEDYIKESPNKTKLFPHTIETLEYLKAKGYGLFLVTNGFLEVQRVKIKDSKLEPFFEKMITSEEVGYQKPSAKIFEYALKIAQANVGECIMIGDDLESDIKGAQQFGMDTIFFNPQNLKHQTQPTYEINGLDELRIIL